MNKDKDKDFHHLLDILIPLFIYGTLAFILIDGELKLIKNKVTKIQQRLHNILNHDKNDKSET
jgi:hypothetical protein